MMRYLAGLLLTGVLALLLTSSAVDAQKKADSLSAEEAAEAQRQTIDELMTAYWLIEFGEKNKAPEALITAASLFRKLARVEMSACTEKPDITADPEGVKSDLVDQEAEAPNFDVQANTLFAQALVMGNELKLNLGPLVNSAKNRTEYRHPVGGPKNKSRFIGPHQNDTYHFKLQSNSPTNFGFRSNVPMRVTVVRNATNHVMLDRMGTVSSAAWLANNNKSGPVGITLQVRNPAKVRAQYHFWLK